MTKGAGSPANRRVFFRMMPLTMIAAIPMKYALVATQADLWKMAPAIMEMKGTFALQGIKVVVMMVMRRSRSFSIVRDAMMPGTPQPTPISMGMKDFPLRPNFRKIRSSTKAIRAMYPQASRKASSRNSTSIWGTKPSTAPTPATMPSRIRPFSQSAVPMLSRPLSTSVGMPGTQVP